MLSSWASYSDAATTSLNNRSLIRNIAIPALQVGSNTERSEHHQRLTQYPATQVSKRTTNLGPMHSQLQSPLFKLPAELRTAIYQYAFVATLDRDGYIDIRSEALPSFNLPLTCHRIHKESTGVQRKTYEEFRTNRPRFKLEITITGDDLSPMQLRDICSLSDEEFRCISHLHIVLVLNLGCSQNTARSRINLQLYKTARVWRFDINHRHRMLKQSCRELDATLHELDRLEFDGLHSHVEATRSTVYTWAPALWPPEARGDHLKMLLKGYMEWLNSLLRKPRREFDEEDLWFAPGAPAKWTRREQLSEEQFSSLESLGPPPKPFPPEPNQTDTVERESHPLWMLRPFERRIFQGDLHTVS